MLETLFDKVAGLQVYWKEDANTGVFLCMLRKFSERAAASDSICFRMSLYNYKFGWRKCSLKLDYAIEWPVFKDHVKIVRIYMVKFVSILNRLKTMFFFVNIKYIPKYVSLNTTLTKVCTILTKCFLPISEPYKLP